MIGIKHRHQHQHVHFLDYYGYQSRLNGWNASLKSAFAIINLLVCIIADQWIISTFIALSMGYFIVGKGKLRFHTYLELLKIPVLFMLFSGVAIAINISKAVTDHVGISLGFCYLFITSDSLIHAGCVFLKAFGAVSTMYMLTLTTTSDEVIHVLRKCHIPQFVIELMYLIYRYIFVLMDIHKNMQQAAQARAGENDFLTSLRTFGKIADNLLIVSMKKAGTYYDAMISRGYDGELNFLEPKKPVTKKQIVDMTLHFMLLTVMLTWVISIRRGH